MRNLAVLGFYGASNSGKTTLIEKIIKDLSKEGMKIATIKKTDKQIGIDNKNKDTYKFKNSGSKLVIFSSKSETDIIIDDYLETDEILKLIENIGLYDLILIEGANDENTPKIRIGENRNIRNNTILTYDGNYSSLIDLIKNNIIKR